MEEATPQFYSPDQQQNNMKRISSHIILPLLLLLSACGENTSRTSEGELVSQINSCARLYTSQYNIHKIITYEDMEKIEGTFFSEKISIPIPGDRKILIPIEATIKSYIDFSQFSDDNVSINGKKISILLPQPQIELTSSQIDYENEKEFISWNRSNFSEEEKEEFIRQGRISILNDIAQSDLLEKSRLSAFNALLPILTSAGYTPSNITISFPEKTTEEFKTGKLLLPFPNP